MIAEADEHDGESINSFIAAMNEGRPSTAMGAAQKKPLTAIQKGALRERLILVRKGYQATLLEALLGASYLSSATPTRASPRSPQPAKPRAKPRAKEASAALRAKVDALKAEAGAAVAAAEGGEGGGTDGGVAKPTNSDGSLTGGRGSTCVSGSTSGGGGESGVNLLISGGGSGGVGSGGSGSGVSGGDGSSSSSSRNSSSGHGRESGSLPLNYPLSTSPLSSPEGRNPEHQIPSASFGSTPSHTSAERSSERLDTVEELSSDDDAPAVSVMGTHCETPMWSPKISARRVSKSKLMQSSSILAAIPAFGDVPAPSGTASIPGALGSLAASKPGKKMLGSGGPAAAAGDLATATGSTRRGSYEDGEDDADSFPASESRCNDSVLRRKSGGASRSQRLSDLSAVAAGAPGRGGARLSAAGRVFHSAAW